MVLLVIFRRKSAVTVSLMLYTHKSGVRISVYIYIGLDDVVGGYAKLFLPFRSCLVISASTMLGIMERRKLDVTELYYM